MEFTKNTLLEKILNFGIFKGISEVDCEKILNFGSEKVFNSGEHMIHDGDQCKSLYLVLDGSLVVSKIVEGKKQILKTVVANDVIGGMHYVKYNSGEDCCYFYDVVAESTTKILEISFEKFKDLPFFEKINTEILANITKDLSKNLRMSDSDVVKNLEMEVLQKEDQVYNGSLLFWMLFVTSLYIVFLRPAIGLKKYLTGTTPISTVVLTTYLIMILIIIINSKRPASFFGFTLNNWKKTVIERVFYTTLIMFSVMAIKYALIHLIPQFHGVPIFDLNSGLNPNKPFEWPVFFISVAVYIAFCPVQEIIVRGGLQGPISSFVDGSDLKKMWVGILCSNAMFATIHSHLSFQFSLLMIIPGIFWGWLYHRQKTLVGVIISHIMLGVWACFICSIEAVFRSY